MCGYNKNEKQRIQPYEDVYIPEEELLPLHSPSKEVISGSVCSLAGFSGCLQVGDGQISG